MAGKTTLNLVVQAALKLDARTPEWHNVIAFIQSCYGGRVREYDLDEATASLSRLSEPEQHALITYLMLIEEVRSAEGRTGG